MTDVRSGTPRHDRPLATERPDRATLPPRVDPRVSPGRVAPPARGRRPAPRPRRRPSRALVAVLCGLLGFGLVAAVHTHRSPAALQSARQEDLVRILDGLTSQSDRLRQQIDTLQADKQRLASAGDQAQVALEEAHRQADTLAVLAGTVPAAGPGITLVLHDPARQLTADNVLDAVEELRDAGAEAMEVGPAGHAVRVVASTAFTDAGSGAIRVDGTVVGAPYRIAAIGDAGTLAAAMRIPGGIVDTVQRAGGSADLATQGRLEVTAVRPLQGPRYAHPTAQPSASPRP